MLAANAKLDSRARFAAAFGSDGHQIADAILIQSDERILFEDAGVDILVEETRGVVARNADRGLRQIVRAEREELRRLCDLVSPDRGAVRLSMLHYNSSDEVKGVIEALEQILGAQAPPRRAAR